MVAHRGDRREVFAAGPWRPAAILTGMTSTSGPTAVTNRYASGALQSTGWMLDGEMHGPWEFFRKDGSMMRSGEFDRGTQIGTWRTFDRDGRLVKETAFAPRG